MKDEKEKMIVILIFLSPFPLSPSTYHLVFDDKELRCRVIKAGGEWLQEKKCWKIGYGEALKPGLKERIVK
ncbi:MAG: hypothetical protein BMS9Abin25_1421 [Gammaproteobacteria bacterium]|nr:MAG: hypothetical protein BMS9Abin25_1421 [Gammaproteobacteria bacterium]